MLHRAILNSLMQDSHPISGQQLADRLHVSHSAIWKTIRELRQSGYDIEMVDPLGYQLTQLSTDLDAAQIQIQLDPFWQDLALKINHKFSPIRDLVRRIMDKYPYNTGILIAQPTKTLLKSDLKKSEDEQLTFSFLLYPTQEEIKSPVLYLIMTSVTMAQVLEDILGEPIEIQGLDGLNYQGKQIATFSWEVVHTLREYPKAYLQIDICLNILASYNSFYPNQNPNQGSLFIYKTPEDFNPNQILVEFLNRIANYLAHFEDKAFIPDFQNHLRQIDKQIKFESSGKQYQGILRGVNLQGNLELENYQGEILSIPFL